MKYNCTKCEYTTDIKSNYKRHLKLKSHGNSENINQNNQCNNNQGSEHNEILNLFKKYMSINEDEKETYICEYCNKFTGNINELDKHYKLECKMNISYDNIYEFDNSTLGSYLFKGHNNAGEIYIVQTDYSAQNNYKIGVTQYVNSRIGNYRTGSVYEPRILYYIPCCDIKKADQLIKNKLKKYCKKREIYFGDLEEIKDIITTVVGEINNGIANAYKPGIKRNDIVKCTKCKKILQTHNEFIFHIKEIHHENFNDLDITDYDIQKMIDYIKKSNKQNELIIECSGCGKKLTNYTSFLRHKKKTCEKEKNDVFDENIQLKNKVLDENIQLKNRIMELKNELKIVELKTENRILREMLEESKY